MDPVVGAIHLAMGLLILAAGCVLMGMVGAIVTAIRYRIHNRKQLGNQHETQALR